MEKPWAAWKLFRGEKEDGIYASLMAERLKRIAGLKGDEKVALQWMQAGYSARWIRETMLLDKRSARELFGTVYRKLGVHNAREACKYYRPQLLQEDLPDPE